jgi:hypothetical protein
VGRIRFAVRVALLSGIRTADLAIPRRESIMTATMGDAVLRKL